VASGWLEVGIDMLDIARLGAKPILAEGGSVPRTVASPLRTREGAALNTRSHHSIVPTWYSSLSIASDAGMHIAYHTSPGHFGP
jgi:hypothetical protein